jgi:hypothetical protein
MVELNFRKKTRSAWESGKEDKEDSCTPFLSDRGSVKTSYKHKADYTFLDTLRDSFFL